MVGLKSLHKWIGEALGMVLKSDYGRIEIYDYLDTREIDVC